MKLKLTILFVGLFALGCQDEQMASKFEEGRPVLLTDENGNRYVAEYRSGDLYTLKPINTTANKLN